MIKTIEETDGIQKICRGWEINRSIYLLRDIQCRSIFQEPGLFTCRTVAER